jgi:hypothetical protein
LARRCSTTEPLPLALSTVSNLSRVVNLRSGDLVRVRAKFT